LGGVLSPETSDEVTNPSAPATPTASPEVDYEALAREADWRTATRGCSRRALAFP
jgi:hypothetical protein